MSSNKNATSIPSTTTTTPTTTPAMQKGTGTITTSGTVVMGHDTIFQSEIQVGDAILVTILVEGDANENENANENGNERPSSSPSSQQQQQQQRLREEMRIVTMRLSNQSLNLSSAFSRDIQYPTSFSYIRKPKDIRRERQQREEIQRRTLQEQQAHAFGTYASQQQLIYREKTETGSYRIKREEASDAKSRGDLLELRAKKTSDKYC